MLAEAVLAEAVLAEAVLAEAVLAEAVLAEAVLAEAVLPEAGELELDFWIAAELSPARKRFLGQGQELRRQPTSAAAHASWFCCILMRNIVLKYRDRAEKEWTFSGCRCPWSGEFPLVNGPRGKG